MLWRSIMGANLRRGRAGRSRVAPRRRGSGAGSLMTWLMITMGGNRPPLVSTITTSVRQRTDDLKRKEQTAAGDGVVANSPVVRASSSPVLAVTFAARRFRSFARSSTMDGHHPAALREEYIALVLSTIQRYVADGHSLRIDTAILDECVRVSFDFEPGVFTGYFARMDAAAAQAPR